MEEEKTETEIKDQDGIHKIAITKEAERALSEVVDKVNDGYNGGRASRMGVSSWIINQFAKVVSAVEIKTMRLEFLNELSLLELCLKRSKEAGKLSPELKKLLMHQMGLMDEPVRKSARSKATDELAQDASKEAA